MLLCCAPEELAPLAWEGDVEPWKKILLRVANDFDVVFSASNMDVEKMMDPKVVRPWYVIGHKVWPPATNVLFRLCNDTATIMQAFRGVDDPGEWLSRHIFPHCCYMRCITCVWTPVGEFFERYEDVLWPSFWSGVCRNMMLPCNKLWLTRFLWESMDGGPSRKRLYELLDQVVNGRAFFADEYLTALVTEYGGQRSLMDALFGPYTPRNTLLARCWGYEWHTFSGGKKVLYHNGSGRYIIEVLTPEERSTLLPPPLANEEKIYHVRIGCDVADLIAPVRKILNLPIGYVGVTVATTTLFHSALSVVTTKTIRSAKELRFYIANATMSKETWFPFASEEDAGDILRGVCPEMSDTAQLSQHGSWLCFRPGDTDARETKRVFTSAPTSPPHTELVFLPVPDDDKQVSQGQMPRGHGTRRYFNRIQMPLAKNRKQSFLSMNA